MRKMFFAALSAVALTATMGAAQAATVVESTTIAAVNPHSGTVTSNFTLAGFNTSLGTLTGVTLNLTNTAYAYLDINNLGNANAATYSNANADVTLSVTVPYFSTFSTHVYEDPAVGTTAANWKDVLNGASVQYVASSSVASADFSAFETTPVTFTYTVDGSDTYITGQVNGDADLGGGAWSGATLEVVYTYAVPEAAVWTMLMFGFGMIGLVLRAGRNSAMLRTA